MSEEIKIDLPEDNKMESEEKLSTTQETSATQELNVIHDLNSTEERIPAEGSSNAAYLENAVGNLHENHIEKIPHEKNGKIVLRRSLRISRMENGIPENIEPELATTLRRRGSMPRSARKLRYNSRGRSRSRGKSSTGSRSRARSASRRKIRTKSTTKPRRSSSKKSSSSRSRSSRTRQLKSIARRGGKTNRGRK